MADSITKKDLVDLIANRNSTITKTDINTIVQSLLEEIVKNTASGKRIELRDFGIFEPRLRAPRKARNPKTGATINIPETKTVIFKIGKKFKEKIA